MENKLIELEFEIKQKFLDQDSQISDVFTLINHMSKEDQETSTSKIEFDVTK